MQHFNLYKLPKSKLTNANILCLVRFSSGQNKLVQLLIRSRNNGSRTIRSLLLRRCWFLKSCVVWQAAFAAFISPLYDNTDFINEVLSSNNVLIVMSQHVYSYCLL